MSICTIAEAAVMAKGTCMVSNERLASVPIRSVTIDSRTVEKGSMFIALPGTTQDGSQFVRDAAVKHAACAMVARKALSMVKSQLGTIELPLIVVEQPLEGLQNLAGEYASKFHNIVKIGVTGSCGKTTTKEMIASILSAVDKTAKTPGNLNSEIGLPLSLFQIAKDTRYGVFEMGVDHVGEMDAMLSMWRPQVGVVTNIGHAHLGKMGSTQTIAHEKSKLFHSDIETALLVESSAFRRYIESVRHVHSTPYGLTSTAGIEYTVSKGLTGWTIGYYGLSIDLKAVGRHNLVNAMAAISVAQSLNIAPEAVKIGLESFQSVEGRSRILEGNVTVIEDYYNASTDSTDTILDYMGSIPWKGAKRVILGSMKELGSASESAHSNIGRTLAAMNPDSVMLYGNEMMAAYRVMKQSGYGKAVYITEDFAQLQSAVLSNVKKGDLILVKGSRAMAMERIVPSLVSIA
ncbi:MAG: UDP-N-acetylmuramoyl-tripeptide--D-alanyl-D-alanine ligase [Sphaerochaetaceae bacterium]|jgi:UDP-N-acetylmuramoyl-tripeptide--D-alanyl-D-alanine ligase|nr:UDP-N-acetylmuramoyl-tripeptide--D-alanyl-D-alanine ligase [Sphaerochaetaceae bacterium]MDX9810536.1 UDP-N-acetylmuramoyl-tripeptide--D-alanyl-D-alanine ligase [Sphaerochaetaceae bacterium]